MNFNEFKENCVNKLNKDLCPKITDDFCNLLNQDKYNNKNDKDLLSKIMATTFSKAIEYSSIISMYQIQEYHQWLLEHFDLTQKD